MYNINVPLLATITGVSAGWLIGSAVAASAPLLAHLIRPRPRRTIVLPTARFLARIERETAKGRRLRERLVLACRCLALLLLGLAFATPEWTSRTIADTAGERTVYVLDASASMWRTEAGRTLYEKAHDSVRREIEANAGRELGVVVARRSPIALLPRLTTNTPALLDALRLTPATHEHASLRDALALASALPGADGRSAPRRIVLVTDASRDAFEGVSAGEFANTEIVRLARDGSPTNRAVLAPSVSPARPVEGTEITLGFTIANITDSDGPVPVTIRTPAGVRTERFDVPANARQEIEAPIGALPAGVHTIELSIPRDAMPADDTARIVVAVAPSHRVGVLTRDTSPLRAPLLASLANAELVSIGSLATVGTLLVADPGPIPDDTLAALAEFARQGGTLAWFAGDAESSALLSRLPPPDANRPLFSSIDTVSTPTRAGLTDPDRILGTRVSPSLENALREIPIAARASIKPSSPLDPAIVFGDGTPMLARLPYARGALVVFTVDLTNAPALRRSPVFPLIVSAIAGSPDPTTSRRALVVGERGGGRRPDESPNDPVVSFTRNENGDILDGEAWNIDAREADPRPIDRQAELALLADPESSEAGGASVTVEQSIALWPWLALASLACLASESLLLTRAGRRARRSSESAALRPKEAAA